MFFKNKRLWNFNTNSSTVYIIYITSVRCCWYKFSIIFSIKSNGQNHSIYPIQRCSSKSKFSVVRMSWLIVYVGRIPHTTSRKMALTIQSDSWCTGTYILATIGANINIVKKLEIIIKISDIKICNFNEAATGLDKKPPFF